MDSSGDKISNSPSIALRHLVSTETYFDGSSVTEDPGEYIQYMWVRSLCAGGN